MADIFTAASTNDVSTVSEFLKISKENCHSKDQFGQLALHHASKAGHSSVVDMLLEAGSMPMEKSNQGVSSAHLAARMQHLEVLKKLMTHKFAEPDSRTRDGKTILDWAAMGKDGAGKEAVISYLKSLD